MKLGHSLLPVVMQSWLLFVFCPILAYPRLWDPFVVGLRAWFPLGFVLVWLALPWLCFLDAQVRWMFLPAICYSLYFVHSPLEIYTLTIPKKERKRG